jgi:hypothetical protein
VAALAAMAARAAGLRSAVLLCNAPATEREFNTFRTARDLTFALRFPLTAALRLAFNPAPRPAAGFEPP